MGVLPPSAGEHPPRYNSGNKKNEIVDLISGSVVIL